MVWGRGVHLVGILMTKWLLFGILASGAAGGALAQESGKPVFTREACGSSSANIDSAAASAPQHFFNDFLSTSAGNAPFKEFVGQKFGDMGFAGAKFAPPVTAAALPPAAPQPQRIHGDSFYRWELGVGFTYVKFRSPAIDASMAGLNTSVTYLVYDWLGVEGNITAAFGRKIFVDDQTRYAGLTGGPKIVMRRGRWEPWAHALFGIAHVNPQLAGVSKSGVAIQLGGGADYNFPAPIALRFEGNWVRTQLYSLSQNNFQVVVGAVFHF